MRVRHEPALVNMKKNKSDITAVGKFLDPRPVDEQQNSTEIKSFWGKLLLVIYAALIWSAVYYGIIEWFRK